VPEMDIDKEAVTTQDIKAEPEMLQMASRPSFKWMAPMDTCIGNYPTDLQSKALEHVNLSPRVVSSPSTNMLPIPYVVVSQPSDQALIELLEYMGVPHRRRHADFAKAAVHGLPANAALRANTAQEQGQVTSHFAVLSSKTFLSYRLGRRDFVEGSILLYVWSSLFFKLRCEKRTL
jgi:hypothetical protein